MEKDTSSSPAVAVMGKQFSPCNVPTPATVSCTCFKEHISSAAYNWGNRGNYFKPPFEQITLDHINLNGFIILLTDMVFHDARVLSTVLHRNIVEGELVEEVFGRIVVLVTHLINGLSLQWLRLKGMRGKTVFILGAHVSVLTFLSQFIWATCPTSMVTLQNRSKSSPTLMSLAATVLIQRLSPSTISNSGFIGIVTSFRAATLGKKLTKGRSVSEGEQ